MVAALRAFRSHLRTSFPIFLQRRNLGHFRTFCTALAAGEDLPSPPSPGRKVLERFRKEFEVGSRNVSIETGKIARFVNGVVVIVMDDTNVLSTVASSKGDGSSGFLPLSISHPLSSIANI